MSCISKSCSAFLMLVATAAVSAVGVGLIGANGAAVSQAPLSVQILVVDFEGQPVSEAPVEVVSSREAVFAFTDAMGSASVTLEVAPDDTSLVARMSHGGEFGPVPADLRPQAIGRYHVLREQFAFPECQRYDAAGPGPHLITIVAGESVVVSGRVLDGSGAVVSTVVGARGSQAYDVIAFDELGVFELKGVRRGKATTLWIGGDASQVHFMDLAAGQLQADLDLGDVTVVDTPRDATVYLTVSNFADLEVASRANIEGALTFVAADDFELHQFGYSAGGVTYSSPSPTAPLVPGAMVPAGTYYVVPGGLGSQPASALFDLVRAGNQAQLDAAGITKVSVDAGQQVSVDMDAAAVLTAILAVAGNAACPCECQSP